ncbi:hypothetical protein EXU85_24400 [Spirosoma sp. KCTC 42546]|uniref:hypothetical protein n=1 Tax=Spirosoma sp. KCTC 42546 TaxID=2520506 RepID=UPI00115B8A84|nr:hypothetical protein [Spirosoma sp. KCTC 42546]QDK81580.1 hypothetical protein EXU85_24400 [Spirosoma sp. KCTC 42546]
MPLTREILHLNTAIQQMTPAKGIASLEKAFSQLQELLDRLRQTNEHNPRYLLAWNLVTYYAPSDLKTLQESFANSQRVEFSAQAIETYEMAFTHFMEQLDLAISLLV